MQVGKWGDELLCMCERVRVSSLCANTSRIRMCISGLDYLCSVYLDNCLIANDVYTGHAKDTL